MGVEAGSACLQSSFALGVTPTKALSRSMDSPMASLLFVFDNRDGYPRGQCPGRESSTGSEEMKPIDDLGLCLFIFPENNQIVFQGPENGWGSLAQLPNRLRLRSPSIMARCNPRAPSVLFWNGCEAI